MSREDPRREVGVLWSRSDEADQDRGFGMSKPKDDFVDAVGSIVFWLVVLGLIYLREQCR